MLIRRLRLPVLAVVLFAASLMPAAAAQAPVVLQIPDGAQAGPGFDVGIATDAYISLLSEADRARSDAYMEGGYWLQLWGFLYGLGISWLLLAARVSAAVRNLAERVGRWPWLQTLLYAMLYIVVTTLLFFPLTVYRGFLREHEYGLATQTFGPWLGEQFTGLAVSILLGGIAITLIYAVIRKARDTWWIWGSAVSVMLLAFMLTIAPVFIAPLFNDYHSLEEGPLRDSILAMARANEVPAEDVYWFDASRQTTRISANVSGLFGTTRIALNDNLLNRTSAPEIEAVMAHEMGHYVLHHGAKLILGLGLVIAIGFVFVARTFDWVLHRYGARWDVRAVSDVAGYPLFTALFSIFLFVATPVVNGIIRIHEAEADNYALNVSRQPDGFARVAMRLSEYRKISPGKWEKVVFYDHPSGRDRVYRAMLWKSVNQDVQNGMTVN